MPTIYLYNVNSPQTFQTGNAGTPPDLKLRSGDATPVNIKLYPVLAGILSTLTNYQSLDIILYPVIDDTVLVQNVVTSISVILNRRKSIKKAKKLK